MNFRSFSTAILPGRPLTAEERSDPFRILVVELRYRVYSEFLDESDFGLNLSRHVLFIF
jgi:hypothetical protein